MELSVANLQSRAVYQRMELPHDHNGELDWRTLGNMLSAHILGEVLQAKYVDYKYGRVSKDFHADTSWQFSYEEDGIIVLRKTFSDSPLHAFMGRGVIELPIEEVSQFIRNVHHRKKWDKHLVNIEVLREISDSDFIVRMHHRATKCLVRAERDMLYFERACNVGDKFVMTCLSVEHPDFPKVPGLIRAQVRPGSGWVLEPYDGKRTETLVSYLAHLDLTSLPPIITNRVLRRQVMAVRYVRNILTPSHNECNTTKPTSLSSLLPWQSQGRGREGGGEGGVEGEGGGTEEDEPGKENDATVSGVHFEEPVSLYAFTRSRKDLLRLDSVPWDMDHRWSGDDHGHTHQEVRQEKPSTGSAGNRVRSDSDGAQAKFYSISPHVQGIGLGLDPRPQVKGKEFSSSATEHLPPLPEETQIQARRNCAEGSSEGYSPPKFCQMESDSSSEQESHSPPSRPLPPPPPPPPPVDSRNSATNLTQGEGGTDQS